MRLHHIQVLFALAFIFGGMALFAADYQLADLYDPLDPRLPGIKVMLLSRLEIANGAYQSLNPWPDGTSGVSGFNRIIAKYLAKPSKHFLNYNQDDFAFQGDFRLKLNWLGINEDDKNISNLQSSITASGKATIKGKIEVVEEITAFRSDSTHNLAEASNTGEFLNDPLLFYPAAWQGPVAGDKNTLDFQTDRAFIKTNLWGIDIQTGRDRIQTKVGYRNSLLFSGLARPVDMYYRIDYNIWRFDLMALSGQLTASGKRYISAKRLGVRFAHNLHAGVTEVVGFNDDATAYINPLMPFFITQRQRPNNDDNLLAAVDISYTPAKNLNLYAEFLDDDFIVFDGGASKYGIMAGLYKSQLFTERLDFHLEYTQVRKWTYTHVTHINNWQYEGQSFGFWLGPDADELYSDLRYLFSPTSSMSLGFNYIRKGEGDLFHPYEDTYRDKTPKFPSGNVEKGMGMWVIFKHQFGYIDISNRLGYREIKNVSNHSRKLNDVFIHFVMLYNLKY
jgi:hypothetical protein